MPIPHADRVVGDPQISLEEARRLLGVLPLDKEGKPITDTKQILKEIFEKIGPNKKLFKDLELEKTERDLYIINIATDAIKKFAREYGRENFVDLPVNNIHFLKEGGVLEIHKRSSWNRFSCN